MVLMLHRTCDGFFSVFFGVSCLFYIASKAGERVRRKVNVLARETKGSALLITATHMNVPVNNFPGSFRRLRENFLCSSVEEKKSAETFFLLCDFCGVQ